MFSDNVIEIHEAWMDLPFTHGRGRTETEAATIPGNYVKSIETDDIGWCLYTGGRLVTYGDQCVVVQVSIQPHWVWKGSQAEYHQTWIVD